MERGRIPAELHFEKTSLGKQVRQPSERGAGRARHERGAHRDCGGEAVRLAHAAHDLHVRKLPAVPVTVHACRHMLCLVVTQHRCMHAAGGVCRRAVAGRHAALRDRIERACFGAHAKIRFITATTAAAGAPAATSRVAAPGMGAASSFATTTTTAKSCAAVPRLRNQPSSASDLIWQKQQHPHTRSAELLPLGEPAARLRALERGHCMLP